MTGSLTPFALNAVFNKSRALRDEKEATDRVGAWPFRSCRRVHLLERASLPLPPSLGLARGDIPAPLLATLLPPSFLLFLCVTVVHSEYCEPRGKGGAVALVVVVVADFWGRCKIGLGLACFSIFRVACSRLLIWDASTALVCRIRPCSVYSRKISIKSRSFDCWSRIFVIPAALIKRSLASSTNIVLASGMWTWLARTNWNSEEERVSSRGFLSIWVVWLGDPRTLLGWVVRAPI